MRSIRLCFYCAMLCVSGAVAQPMAYVANQAIDTISVINVTTGAVVANLATAFAPTSIAVSPDGSRLYAVASTSGLLMVFNTATNQLISTAVTSNNPASIVVAPNNSRAFIANSVAGTIMPVNTATLQILANIRTGFFSPYAMAISPDSRRLYVVHHNSNNVQVFNIESPNIAAVAPVATIATGAAPVGIAVSPDGSSAWVANSGSSSVTRIDLATNRVSATIAVGPEPLAIEVQADNSRVYVTHSGRSQLTTIDTGRNAVTGTASLGTCRAPRCSAVSAAMAPDNILYVAEGNGSDILVVNPDNGTISRRIAVGAGPRSIAFRSAGGAQ